MKRQFHSRAIGAVLLTALTLAVVFWPQKFSGFAHTDRAEAQYMFVYTHDSGSSVPYYSAEVQPEEMERVLALLNDGRLHWRGFWRSITYTGNQTLYSVTLGHEGDSGYVLDARFELLSDGSLYNVWYNVGYIRYRLTGCDMAAVEAALGELVGMAQAGEGSAV